MAPSRKARLYSDLQRPGRDIADHAKAVAYGDSGVVEVDYADPASVLMAAEDEAEQPAPPDRGDVASLLMGHLFGDGPHMEHVCVRFYQLAEAMVPDLLHGLPRMERVMLVSRDDLAQAWRISALLRGTRIRRRKPATHQRVIREVLSSAWARHRELLMSRDVPESALTGYRVASPHEMLVQFQARQEAVQALMKFFLLDGPQPERALRRVFMVAKAYFEPLVLGMSLEMLGRMFGQTRATLSWRGKAKLNDFLAARGAVAVKAPYQKSDAVCVKYAAAATGNRNRATGRRVA
jgi:hypothetical protein